MSSYPVRIWYGTARMAELQSSEGHVMIDRRPRCHIVAIMPGIRRQKLITLCSLWYRFGVQWSSSVLGYKESSATLGDHHSVGEQFCVGLQQGQPQPSVQHVWLRVSHSAQVSNDARRVHSPRRHLEPAK